MGAESKKAIQEVKRVLKPDGVAVLNLYKFSEITTLWFKNEFWNDFNVIEYKQEFEFNENDYQNNFISFRKEKVIDMPPLSDSYYLMLGK